MARPRKNTTGTTTTKTATKRATKKTTQTPPIDQADSNDTVAATTPVSDIDVVQTNEVVNYICGDKVKILPDGISATVAYHDTESDKVAVFLPTDYIHDSSNVELIERGTQEDFIKTFFDINKSANLQLRSMINLRYKYFVDLLSQVPSLPLFRNRMRYK